jgi:ribosomal protein S27E
VSIQGTINTLLTIRKMKCSGCGAALIVWENGRTIVKCKLMIISIIKGAIEIKCRECGQLKVICSN